MPRSLISFRPLRPPPSTLFPYTTLFRSPRRLCRARGGAADVHDGGRRRHARNAASAAGARGREPDGARATAGVAQDRKSTRLNSSHVRISYAVFCLKKKNLAKGAHYHVE